MKTFDTYAKAAWYLSDIFSKINDEYFDNRGGVEIPTITIQNAVGKYCEKSSLERIWKQNKSSLYEINFPADCLDNNIIDIAATLIHEACHLYATQNNIKDTSNNGIYHNKRFKELANSAGLLVSRHKTYGWMLTYPTANTIQFVTKYDFDDMKVVRRGDKKPTSTRKYICPCCGNSFRATKEINVLCMDCNKQFVVVKM